MIIAAIYIHNEMTTPKVFHVGTTPKENLAGFDISLNAAKVIPQSQRRIRKPIDRPGYLVSSIIT